MVGALLHCKSQPGDSSLLARTGQALERLSKSIRSKQLLVNFDCDESASATYCPPNLTRAVECLLELAISRSPKRGEVDVTLLHSQRGIEIEIADCGSQHFDAAENCGAFRCQPVQELAVPGRSNSGAVLPANANLYCARCPQGGVAWTLVITQSAAAEKVA
jgi:hypothetical protein